MAANCPAIWAGCVTRPVLTEASGRSLRSDITGVICAILKTVPDHLLLNLYFIKFKFCTFRLTEKDQ